MAKEHIIELPGAVIKIYEASFDDSVMVEVYTDGSYDLKYMQQKELKELINFLLKQVI